MIMSLYRRLFFILMLLSILGMFLIDSYTIGGKSSPKYVYTDRDEEESDSYESIISQSNPNYPDDDDLYGEEYDKKDLKYSSNTRQSNRIQLMITSRMRNILVNQLAYLPEEVDEMDPQIAAVVIEKSLSRPDTGMPSKWRKTQPNPLVESSKRIKQQINQLLLNLKVKSLQLFHFSKEKILPYAAPVIVGVIGLQFLSYSGTNIDSVGKLFQSSISTLIKPFSYISHQISKVVSSTINSKKKPVNRSLIDLNMLEKVRTPTKLEEMKLRSSKIRRNV